MPGLVCSSFILAVWMTMCFEWKCFGIWQSWYGSQLFTVLSRMNKARTSGYERDVGSRTTHHIIYPESAIDLDNTTSLVFFPFKTLDLQWLPGAITTGSHITLWVTILLWLVHQSVTPCVFQRLHSNSGWNVGLILPNSSYLRLRPKIKANKDLVSHIVDHDNLLWL